MLSSLYVLFIAVYLFQILALPADKATLKKYHLGTTQVRVLALTVAIPYIIIWLVALVGYLRLKAYTGLIKKDKDGAAFQKISQGIFWLTLWLPLSTIIANFFSQFYGSHHGVTANLIRLNNYLFLILLFVGFLLVNRGTNKLLVLVKKPAWLAKQSVVIVYIIFAALYILLTLHDSARALPTKTVAVASYYEPDWLIVVSLVIPRLIYWFLGVQAVQNIYTYRQKVRGKLYKQALNYLTIGLAGVLVMTISLRCLQSLAAPLAQLSLGLLLGLVYALLILIAISYVFIAKGAKQLQQLEEV